MKNKKMNFASGMGIGLVVGSAVSAAIATPKKNNSRKSKVGKALRTMGDVVENIGSTISG